jgi:hypothetical protein
VVPYSVLVQRSGHGGVDQLDLRSEHSKNTMRAPLVASNSQFAQDSSIPRTVCAQCWIELELLTHSLEDTFKLTLLHVINRPRKGRAA